MSAKLCLCVQCRKGYDSTATYAYRFCSPTCHQVYIRARRAAQAAQDRIESMGRFGLFDVVPNGLMKHNFQLAEGGA